ncbi:MAG: hypothetical protein KF850_38840 [Labilithrix sp.]|nr:hypothetical protein [Labilithrix sp.]MBX3218028.1 hypothetical protein [Labilithrix sp.]
MSRARSLGVVVFACAALAPGPARADGGDAGDVGALEEQLDAEHASLSSSSLELATRDCIEACRALGSIRRAAERICALEPGPRCDSAREKAADATRRVRDACPDCAIAASPVEPPPSPERAVAMEAATTRQAEAPGGCRSCTATGAGRTGVDAGALVLAALAALRLAGPRRRRD